MKKGCATLIALNKWDISGTDLEDAQEKVASKLRLRPRVLKTLIDTRGLPWCRTRAEVSWAQA